MIATKSVGVLAGLLWLLLWPAHAVAQQADWERHISAGDAAYGQGNYAEAVKQIKAALSLAEAFGPNDPRLGGTLYALALLYNTQGRYAEAEPLYKRALAIWEKALGPDYPNVATTLENYAAVLRKTGRTTEAVKLEARAKAIRAKHALVVSAQDDTQNDIRELDRAVTEDDFDKVQALIRKGVPVNPSEASAASPYGTPFPLWSAVYGNNIEMAKLLIDNGADVNYPKDSSGSTWPVLHQAVGGGHLEMAKLLISRGADINRDVSLMGTPLIQAMKSVKNKNKYATVKLLVEHGANVNQRSKMQVFRMGKWDCLSTPLHAAVFGLDKDIVKFLIQKGADTSITDHKGKTPLQCAQDRYEIIKTPAAKPEIQEIINILTPPKP